MCLSVCLLVCITKSNLVVKEFKLRSSRIFQFTSFPLGCAILQAILLMKVSVSVDGATFQTVSTNILLLHTFILKIAHIKMTVSRAKKTHGLQKTFWSL